MKEKQTAPEKLIVIDIKLTRGLVVALSCVVVLGAWLTFLTLAGDSASASEIEAAPATSTSMRQFYLTLTTTDGDEALTACAAGYHMASLWEIADPSNLKYNTALGRTKPDSGQGPPTNEHGWVRTGYEPDDSLTVGQGNCDAWTSDHDAKNGTMAVLWSNWTDDTEEIGVWTTGIFRCDLGLSVWCIED
jgi:hypothetical protein